MRALSAPEILEAYQLKSELEGLAAEFAVAWITDEQIARMKKAQARFIEAVNCLSVRANRCKSTASSISDGVDSNEAFHATILEASGNRKLKP